MMGNTGILNVLISQTYIYLSIFTVVCKSQGNTCLRSTSATVITCESSIPEFDTGNNIRILNHIKCRTGKLSNETLNNLEKLEVLSISCGFSGGVRLELEPEVFTSVKNTLKQLNLNRNNIRKLPDGIFCELSNVTDIDLSKNSMTDIDNVGFRYTNCGGRSSPKRLSQLEIQENEIKILRNGTFQNLPKLEFLNASYNGLEQIETSAFDGLLALSAIDLSGNRLTKFPPQAFQKLTTLYSLNLARNALISSSLANVSYPEGLNLLDLSSNRMTTVDASMFQTLGTLSDLDLSYNQLSFLNSGFSSLVSLTKLLLNNAGIKDIKPEAFNGLSGLKELDLGDNELRELEPGTFADVAELQHLQLSGNNLLALPDAKSWSGMKTLKFARNAIGNLKGFASYNLRNLKELDLSNNLIEIIETDTFVNSPSLYLLNLSHNKIRHIDNNAFDSLILFPYSSLSVNLDNNELTNIDNCFQTTNFTSISLNNNKLSNFSYASMPVSLERLYLSHNQISKIVNELYASNFETKKIKSIDFSHNQIDKVSPFDIPSWIEEVDLHNNSIQHVDELFLKPLFRLKTLKLHNNKIEMLCPPLLLNREHSPVLTTTLSGNPFYCSCELEWLKYQNSDIGSNFGYIKDLQFVHCHSMIPRNGTYFRNITQVWNSAMFLCKSTNDNSNSCQCTSSDSSQCELPCPKKCSCYRNGAGDFTIVDCSVSNLTTMPVIAFRQVPMVHLFVDGNDIGSIDESSFLSYSNINKLYLNSSHLKTINQHAFRNMASLELLQLNHNMLRQLPAAIFAGLSNLKELYLAYNRLVQLQDGLFRPTTSLQILHLNNNFLKNFSVWELAKLQQLKNVGLQHNEWICDCTYIDKFRNWLQEYVNIVHDADKLVCTARPSGQEIPLISFSFDECYNVTSLQYLVSWAPIWGSSLGVVLLVFLSLILVFVYRREMQVLIYSRYGVRIFSKNAGESDENKVFDAFISYSCLDEDFLLSEFLPGLEQIENPFHLCLHHRDFIVGAFISDNIMEAVEKSRRTIMLLSENFIKSEWCRFEFKTAHIQMMKDRCNRVIIVVLGEVPEGLDPEMKLYLTTNTFLKWGDKLFWKKLYFVLPDKNKN